MQMLPSYLSKRPPYVTALISGGKKPPNAVKLKIMSACGILRINSVLCCSSSHARRRQGWCSWQLFQQASWLGQRFCQARQGWQNWAQIFLFSSVLLSVHLFSLVSLSLSCSFPASLVCSFALYIFVCFSFFPPPPSVALSAVIGYWAWTETK